jgi:hypothetical protein
MVLSTLLEYGLGNAKVLDKAGNGKYIGKLEVDTYEANQDQQGIVEVNKALNAKADFTDDDIPF